MGGVFVDEKLADPYIVTVDSTMLRARKGLVWHKKSMEKNVVPYSGIDTDARWGKSRTKGWVYGYKLHISCSTGRLIVPLSADFTTANVPDNQRYGGITASLRGVRYVDGDEGYDDGDLYRLSVERGFELVCPISRYENTPPERLELVFFYESELGQLVYSWRLKSVEPLSDRADQGCVRHRPTTCQRVRDGTDDRSPFCPPIPGDGLLQPSHRKTAEGAQAHAWKLDGKTVPD
jgi:hypothetical protein